MELAGHRSIARTMRYSHLAPSHIQQAVEKLFRIPGATTTATGENGAAMDERKGSSKLFSSACLAQRGRVAQTDRASDF